MDIERLCHIGTSLGVPLMRLGRDDIQIGAEDMARAALPEGTGDWRTWLVYGEYQGSPECHRHYECVAPGGVRIVACELTYGYPRQAAPLTDAERAHDLAGPLHAATLALDNIHAAMSGKVWDAETMHTVANILAETGRTVAEPPEYDEDGYSDDHPRCEDCDGQGSVFRGDYERECLPCKGTGYEGGNEPPLPPTDDERVPMPTDKARA